MFSFFEEINTFLMRWLIDNVGEAQKRQGILVFLSIKKRSYSYEFSK